MSLSSKPEVSLKSSLHVGFLQQCCFSLVFQSTKRLMLVITCHYIYFFFPQKVWYFLYLSFSLFLFSNLKKSSGIFFTFFRSVSCSFISLPILCLNGYSKVQFSFNYFTFLENIAYGFYCADWRSFYHCNTFSVVSSMSCYDI